MSGPDGARSASAGDPPAAPPPLPVDHVAIVGLGLMGGSLARALKDLDPAPRVDGMTASEADARAALEAGAVDRVHASPEGLEAAQLVVYATPLSDLLDVLPDHAPHLGGSLVSDVASLKAPVTLAMRRQGLEDRYVGSHPMTGGEASGFGASVATLYRSALVHLTTDTGSDDARAAVETFWRALGARPSWIGADAHDRRMVWASHLPQLVANALARALAGAGVDPEDLGPGGRDMTRLAASSPLMWRDVVAHSAELNVEALRTAARELEDLAAALEEGRLGHLDGLMEETRRWRRGGPPR